MADRDALREMIKDEVAQAEVKVVFEAEDDAAWPTRVWDGLRHPLLIAIAGFGLTFFVGGAIENQVSESNRLAQNRDLRVERAYALETQSEQIVRDFVELVHRRAIESNLLRSAIERRSTPEFLPRKAAYDDTYREWNEKEAWHALGLRRVWASDRRALLEEESPYETVAAEHISRVFGWIDSCLTRNFDRVAKTVMSDERYTNIPGNYCAHRDDGEEWADFVQNQSRRIRRCSLAIMNLSLGILRQRTDAEVARVLGVEGEDTDLEMTEEEVTKRLDEACAERSE